MNTRISKTFKALFAIAKNPWLLNHVLGNDTLWQKQVANRYGISSLPVVDINTLLPNFSEELSTFAFLEGGSLPTDLCLIRALCKTVPNCSYFEIGTCRGESIVNVAGVCSRCDTLDLAPEQFSDKAEGKLVGFFSKGNNKITQHYGDSRTFNYAGLNQKFDVLFIDGDHHYEFVKSDTAHIFKHLVHDNSIVIWHDYAFDPVTIRHEVMAGILDAVPANLHKNLYHVSNTLCALYINKKLPVQELPTLRMPSKKFRVTVKGVDV